MKRILFTVNNNRVTCIVTAVELNDVIGVLSQLVGSFSLAFVAPLGAENDDGGHIFSVFQCIAGMKLLRAQGATDSSLAEERAR